MSAKLAAADLARRGGAEVVIAAGGVEDVVLRVTGGERLGTRFTPLTGKLESRKRWRLLGGLVQAGRITGHAGAAAGLGDPGPQLVTGRRHPHRGPIQHSDAVRICNAAGQEIARGLTRYGAEFARAYQGPALGRHRRHSRLRE